MGEHIEAPWIIQWIAKILWTLPGPTDAWADIVGSVAWPAVVLFLVLRFRLFIRRYLLILADRLQRDHVKIGPFELRPNDQVLVLDPEAAKDSTQEFDAADVQRIERIFAFISDDEGWRRLIEWMNQSRLEELDVVDFITLPMYASLREQACNEVEGLKA